jgi:protein-L-isoaspartate(D-aspartate) O-methyltransferase
MLKELAREQMIEQQLRCWDVFDERALDTLRAVPRERFVPPAWRELAFADCEIALPRGKRMLRPMIAGRILQELGLRGGEEILEVGTGSGYLTACLARLGGRVRSLELHPDIADFARTNLLAAAPTLPFEVVVADGMHLADESRYDIVVLTASLPIYQTRFESALRVGGKMFVVVGTPQLQQACLVTRISEREWKQQPLFETSIEALEHAPRPESFGF